MSGALAGVAWREFQDVFDSVYVVAVAILTGRSTATWSVRT